MKNKGFTLVELLAVIVILAVISLIAVPMILGVVEESKKSAFQITCNEIYESYEQYEIREEILGDTGICSVFDFGSNREETEVIDGIKYEPISKLSLKGELPKSGTYKICNGKRELLIDNGDYTCIKDETRNQILNGNVADNDITSPIVRNITLSSTTNSIRVIVDAVEEDGIITKYYYKINGEEVITESEIHTFNELNKNEEYEIEVYVENKSGLKSNVVTEKISTKNINNPTMAETSRVLESGYTWATSRVIQITYSNTNIDNPKYYFKSSVSATVSSGLVIASCGTGTTPENCESSSETTLEADTWYETNSPSPSIVYTSNGTLYALTSDGKNVSGTSAYGVSSTSSGTPTTPTITGGSTSWSNSEKTISISTESTETSGILKYQYYISTSPDSQEGGSWTDVDETNVNISTNGTRYIYMRAVANNGKESEVSNVETTMIDTEGPSVPTTGAIGNVSGSNTTGTIQTEASGSIDAGVGEITYLYLITNTNTTPSKNDTGFTTEKTFTRSCGTSYYAWAIAEDALGNRSEVVSLGNTSDGANSYSAWGSCSKTCGGGTQTRTNTCALITDNLSQACNTQSCCAYSAGHVWNYEYTGGVQSFTVPCSGTYKLEVWGAQGGTPTKYNFGGLGGYSYGNINLSSNTFLYIVIGGSGTSNAYRSSNPGGYNGGGSGFSESSSKIGAGGGGATHIATTNRGVLSNYSSYTSEVLIVAGGGGGGADSSDEYGNGGTGGGNVGGNGSSSSTTSYNAYGTGGNQIQGGYEVTYSGDTGAKGSFGKGGNSSSRGWGPGGGGGYYGGGGGRYSGAGGGSGYIGGVIGGSMSNGQQSGNGYARITLVSIN